MIGVQAALLSGDRLHLQHGPIDLIIGADGKRALAFEAAKTRLGTVLAELMDEIDLLRIARGLKPKGNIALRMWCAAQAHDGFVTPMAGVAGAIAETVLDAMKQATDIKRAYVNNGGDIAVHLEGDAEFCVGIAGVKGGALGKITLNAASSIRGIATSGQGGRSLSLGIADSVTVLGQTACTADVAATLIAGAVDLPSHPMITRQAANEVVDGSDLGARPVVTHVGKLRAAEVMCALEAGLSRARLMQSNGLIQAASLHLQGQSRQIEMNNQKVLEHA
jgi:ApbE superfamily uncharacterized protein (UPF0280 family)